MCLARAKTAIPVLPLQSDNEVHLLKNKSKLENEPFISLHLSCKEDISTWKGSE